MRAKDEESLQWLLYHCLLAVPWAVGLAQMKVGFMTESIAWPLFLSTNRPIYVRQLLFYMVIEVFVSFRNELIQSQAIFL